MHMQTFPRKIPDMQLSSSMAFLILSDDLASLSACAFILSVTAFHLCMADCCKSVELVIRCISAIIYTIKKYVNLNVHV